MCVCVCIIHTALCMCHARVCVQVGSSRNSSQVYLGRVDASLNTLPLLQEDTLGRPGLAKPSETLMPQPERLSPASLLSGCKATPRPCVRCLMGHRVFPWGSDVRWCLAPLSSGSAALWIFVLRGWGWVGLLVGWSWMVVAVERQWKDDMLRC